MRFNLVLYLLITKFALNVALADYIDAYVTHDNHQPGIEHYDKEFWWGIEPSKKDRFEYEDNYDHSTPEVTATTIDNDDAKSTDIDDSYEHKSEVDKAALHDDSEVNDKEGGGDHSGGVSTPDTSVLESHDTGSEPDISANDDTINDYDANLDHSDDTTHSVNDDANLDHSDDTTHSVNDDANLDHSDDTTHSVNDDANLDHSDDTTHSVNDDANLDHSDDTTHSVNDDANINIIEPINSNETPIDTKHKSSFKADTAKKLETTNIYNGLVKHDKAVEHLPDEHVEGDKTFPDNPLLTHNKKYFHNTTHFSNELDIASGRDDDHKDCDPNCTEKEIAESESDSSLTCPFKKHCGCKAHKRGLKSKKTKNKRKSKNKNAKSKKRKGKKRRPKKSKAKDDNATEKEEAKDAIELAKEAKKEAKEAKIKAKEAKAKSDEAQLKAKAKEKRIKAELDVKKEKIEDDEDELDRELDAEESIPIKSKSKKRMRGSKNKKNKKADDSEPDFELPRCKK